MVHHISLYIFCPLLLTSDTVCFEYSSTSTLWRSQKSAFSSYLIYSPWIWGYDLTSGNCPPFPSLSTQSYFVWSIKLRCFRSNVRKGPRGSTDAPPPTSLSLFSPYETPLTRIKIPPVLPLFSPQDPINQAEDAQRMSSRDVKSSLVLVRIKTCLPSTCIRVDK